MKKIFLVITTVFSLGILSLAAQNRTGATEEDNRSSQRTTTEKVRYQPWSNGPLEVSPEGRYLRHTNGTPFFWMGDTGWLLPQKMTRESADYYLDKCADAGFNVIQVQTVCGVPCLNAYGESSHPDGYDFSQVDAAGHNGYWPHLDYIVREAGRRGIYIGMVCIWGGLVKRGAMNVDEAERYGRFLAERYKDEPNIVWIIGGDIRGDVKPEVWETLARTIKSIDKNHLMTFHPFGRSISALWFHEAEWLDFNMFQSGHRRYGQKKTPDEVYPVVGSYEEEDNWRYAEKALSFRPLKPCVDGEPSYEHIPQGLHDGSKGFWTANDVRRYAWWSVFAGSMGHTYGHNAIMQFRRPGDGAAYDAYQYWFEAVEDDGFNQMKHLKNLMLSLPYFERVPDQSVLLNNDGVRYDRTVATRGRDYILAYTYTAAPVTVDLTKISGKRKNIWWYVPANGRLEYVGELENGVHTLRCDCAYGSGNDRVLIAIDAEKTYLQKEQTTVENPESTR